MPRRRCRRAVVPASNAFPASVIIDCPLESDWDSPKTHKAGSHLEHALRVAARRFGNLCGLSW
ncbi:hypothetical protein MSTO_53460 [Mycobacterium stomatepiae]|uniref:Uncharacterized protein n=1 Tax=Mycobacterium stomatepiae TaxID=470076 RepID=A0A7I7QFZ1_9MYCO|nr:hypothetical protein MSTO_53460 [Mycobacterium stomatepiae]